MREPPVVNILGDQMATRFPPTCYPFRGMDRALRTLTSPFFLFLATAMSIVLLIGKSLSGVKAPSPLNLARELPAQISLCLLNFTGKLDVRALTGASYFKFHATVEI